MKLFEWYDEEIKQITDGNDDVDWPLLSPKILSLPIEHRENIYLLILHFAKSKNVKGSTPYGSTTNDGGKGIQFMINKLPIQLQKLIEKYINEVVS
jgi:hypothetical protein